MLVNQSTLIPHIPTRALQETSLAAMRHRSKLKKYLGDAKTSPTYNTVYENNRRHSFARPLPPPLIILPQVRVTSESKSLFH